MQPSARQLESDRWQPRAHTGIRRLPDGRTLGRRDSSTYMPTWATSGSVQVRHRIVSALMRWRPRNKALRTTMRAKAAAVLLRWISTPSRARASDSAPHRALPAAGTAVRFARSAGATRSARTPAQVAGGVALLDACPGPRAQVFDAQWQRRHADHGHLQGAALAHRLRRRDLLARKSPVTPNTTSASDGRAACAGWRSISGLCRRINRKLFDVATSAPCSPAHRPPRGSGLSSTGRAGLTRPQRPLLGAPRHQRPPARAADHCIPEPSER